MSEYGPASRQLIKAVEDFHQARRKAKFESVIGALLGRRTNLLSYDLVRKNLHAI
jgi:hypothetical protein